MLRSIVSKLIINSNRINLKSFIIRFYDFAIKLLRDSKSLTRLLNNNIINFLFVFARALLTYKFLKNKKRENAYK